MALMVAIILATISVALLAVYGADVAISYTNDAREGFLPFDHKIRGIGLGLPALILPFVSFFIARKSPSKAHGGLLILSAILIIAGGAVVITMAPADAGESRNPAMEAGPLIIAGIIIAALGAIKLKRS